jgi:hypothetical protein
MGIKKIIYIIIVVFLVEGIKYLFSYFITFEALNNDNKLSFLQLICIIIGGGWALRLYYLSIKKEKENYLKTYVSVMFNENFLTIKTELNNATDIDRKIYSSFLIITKQGSKIIKEVNSNLNENFLFTNNFSNLKFSENVLKEDFAFIQLPYYFSENVKVGNEDLSFSIGSVDKSRITIDSQIYEVRFFVFRDPKDPNPYHRSVQTVFSSNLTLNLLLKDCAFKLNNTDYNNHNKQNTKS